jgi:hypothetical protein
VSVLASFLDPLHGDGYQFWSGIAGDVFIFTGLLAWWHHVNCIEAGCWRKGHKDPEHGHPLCKRHQKKAP